MFPNVRLLTGALVASIVALSCGFGLFAAFRVNHEPLSRLPVGTTPVQFVANVAVAPSAGWGTPFDGQSHLNGPQRSEIAADAPAATLSGQTTLEAASASTAEPIKPVAVVAPAIEPAPPREIAQPAEVIEPVVSVIQAAATMERPPAPEVDRKISRPDSVKGDAAGQTALSATTLAAGPADGAASPVSISPDETASVASSPADSASPSASAASLSDADSAQPTGTIASAAAPRDSVAAPRKPNSESDAVAPAPAPTPAPIIAIATPSDQPAVVVPPAKKAALFPEATEPANAAQSPVRKIGAKTDSQIVRKPVARRRVAVRRRVVRRLRRSSGLFGDPVFQSAPNFSGATASRGGYNASAW